MIAKLALLDPLGQAVSPLSLAAIGLFAWIWLRGVSRPVRMVGAVSAWRRIAFFAGLSCILAATNAPLAPLGHSLFSLHQIEHLLLRLAGPLLVAASQPWRITLAGLGSNWRRRLRRPGGGRTVGIMARPAVATAALVAALFVWQLPALYGLAQRVAAVEVLAHLSMVLAGLWYFAMLFDPRDPPLGARRGARLISGFAVVVSNIFLGALTTLKEVRLYAPDQITDIGLDLAPLTDETIGGYIIWVPSSMVMIAAIILVFNGWNAAEMRRWAARHDLMRGSNAAALEFPETAEELRLKVEKPNRDMGQTLALGAFAMFAVVMVTMVTIVYAL